MAAPDPIADIRSVCDPRGMKLYAVGLLGLLAADCSASDVPAKALQACWNVNESPVGPVGGQGVFLTSMEGLSLQAPGCSDRSGRNAFELGSPADRSVDDYLSKASPSRFIGFTFQGRIEKEGGNKQLVIERVGKMRPVPEPQWHSDLVKGG